MIRIAMAAAVALIATSGAAWAEGEDEGPFSKGSQAKDWNLLGQEKARFEAKVVDVFCEVAGDCPENCGDGRRQLGLLRSADGVLVLANKNTQPAFTGANLDLLPYCNQEVEVDGLLVGLEEYTPANNWLVPGPDSVRDRLASAFVLKDELRMPFYMPHHERSGQLGVTLVLVFAKRP